MTAEFIAPMDSRPEPTKSQRVEAKMRLARRLVQLASPINKSFIRMQPNQPKRL